MKIQMTKSNDQPLIKIIPATGQEAIDLPRVLERARWNAIVVWDETKQALFIRCYSKS